MMKFALFLLLCTGTFAQRPSFGKCPKLKVVPNFKVHEYMGLWYEYGRYYVALEVGGKCNKFDMFSNEDRTYTVKRSQVNILTGKITSMNARIQLIGKPGEAKLSVTYPASPIQVKRYYSILDTDYRNYSIVYHCQNLGLFHTSSAWILTRERFPDGNIIQKALDVFDQNRLNKNKIFKTDQEDCIY